MSDRKKDRLDYKVLHNTGQKVQKPQERESEVEELVSNFENLRTHKMEQQLANMKSKEKKIVVRLKNMKEPSELYTLSEIEEYLVEIRGIKKDYLYIHVDLEDGLGSEEYKKSYKEYNNILKIMKTKENQTNIRRREEEEKYRNKEQEERSRIEEVKKKRKQEEKEERERVRKEEKEERERLRAEKKEE